MKLLWVAPCFLHPTTRGGQIRTLEIVKRLHRRHEVHFAGLADPEQPEGPERAGEYCSRVIAVPHGMPARGSAAFAGQVVRGLVQSMPVAIRRTFSPALRDQVSQAMHKERYDHIVCDFLASVPNVADLGHAVLFQHNVETMIWRRHAAHAADPLRRAYFSLQASRMERYEAQACRRARSVIAVSPGDRDQMRDTFGVTRIGDVPTGVDATYFAPPPPAGQTTPPRAGIVFTGSMDWMPNIDGILWFAREILPLLRRTHPDCEITIAGRKPAPAIQELARADARIRVTGTVPNIRPFLWGAAAAIVPLRIGGGTRLKIYESMAAGVPVVSTTLGAEGLDYTDGQSILIADTPADFAVACARLLADTATATAIAQTAQVLVAERFSWDGVIDSFEHQLEHPGAAGL